jgi:nucleotide-binding universal stress UspA family protein
MGKDRPWHRGSISRSLFRSVELDRSFSIILSIVLFVQGRNMKIERIMVPTDFSENSLASLKYALELARDHASEVVLLHVVEPLPYGIARWSEPTKLLEEYAETASSELKRFEKEATQLYPQCRSELHFGVVHEVIGELVRQFKIDLVVISMRGRTHLLDLLIGGTAEKILWYAPCPVLRIRTVEGTETGKIEQK